MRLSKKWGLVIGLFGMLLISITSVQAGMVGNDIILDQRERSRLVDLLEREDVQQQLVELGVDPVSARERVKQMTDEEVAQLNGRITELPAGGGIGVVELLLIIIIIILLI